MDLVLFYLRVVLILLWMGICSITILLIAPFRFRDPILNYALCQLFCPVALWIAGIRVRVENEENITRQQPCIYMINHQSAMDYSIMGFIAPRQVVIVAKSELIWLPIFGWVFWASGNILINRKKRIESISKLDVAADSIQERQLSLAILPEGTRNRTGIGMLPFKKGGFHIAVRTGFPIVPVVCAPLSGLVNFKEKRLKSGTVHVRILDPIPTKNLRPEDVDTLIESVRGKMLEAFNALPAGS